MTKTVADQVLDVLATVAESDVVRTDLDVSLYDDGILESLKTVELILTFSRELGVYISPTEFDRVQWATPRKIIAFLEQKVAAAQ